MELYRVYPFISGSLFFKYKTTITSTLARIVVERRVQLTVGFCCSHLQDCLYVGSPVIRGEGGRAEHWSLEPELTVENQ